MRIVLGIVLGLLLSGGFGFLIADQVIGTETATSLAIAAAFAAVGAVYSAIAFGYTVYEAGFFSIFGYIADMTWSWLNTLAGLIVWAPACLISGGNFQPANGDSRRSGSFVYDKNPRGGNFGATTVGTVIGGGWSSHEEVHIWQARIFGPVYLVVYAVSYILNLLFRLLTFRTSDLVEEPYYRICFEEWAYWAGKTSGPDINWLGWIGGFLLTVLYVGLFALIPIGIATGETALWLIGTIGLALYSLIRALLPRGH
jgi:hypothetical protein